MEENFDVILSDIRMPGMDGLTLAGEVRKVKPNAMVILMTGYASVNTAVEAIKRDVFDYILKPAARIIYHHHERYDGKGYPDVFQGRTSRLKAVLFRLPIFLTP